MASLRHLTTMLALVGAASAAQGQSAAIAAFAWRVHRLTPERAEEIAVLAAAAAPRSSGATNVTARLIGVARWQHGQRRRAATPAEVVST